MWFDARSKRRFQRASGWRLAVGLSLALLAAGVSGAQVELGRPSAAALGESIAEQRDAEAKRIQAAGEAEATAMIAAAEAKAEQIRAAARAAEAPRPTGRPTESAPRPTAGKMRLTAQEAGLLAQYLANDEAEGRYQGDPSLKLRPPAWSRDAGIGICYGEPAVTTSKRPSNLSPMARGPAWT